MRQHGPMLMAVLAFLVPALLIVMRASWSTSQGAHGPIVLASGLWLLWREWRVAPAARPGRFGWAVALLLPCLALYIFGMIVGIAWLIWMGVGGSIILTLYALAGGERIRALWFPLLYLLCAVPPPARLTAPLTDFLTGWLSGVSVDLLWAAGFDVARSGVDLYIDQYELRMADACAGLNSLFSLFAIGMFYIYLRHRADWRYGLLLALIVPPVAVIANLARVLILMLITHYMGDAVAQGLLHETTGMVMFIVALLVLIAIDAALTPLRRRLSRL
ncbi:exosortase [Sphingobium sp. CAP-1]|uniref:exosortase n=1 Tax=Sphingobium sp. CAP-1 TaxID=2676077 RepID=UPI0018AD13EC|nr:exosortase [Sphingobium sp. CAP-1]